MKKKSVIAINLCLIASIVTLFGNKIYMLYIGDCHQLWEEAQTHYVNRQYEKARELLEKIAHIDTAHHAQYLTGDMYLKGLGGEIDYDKALKLFHQSAAPPVPNPVEVFIKSGFTSFAIWAAFWISSLVK